MKKLFFGLALLFLATSCSVSQTATESYVVSEALYPFQESKNQAVVVFPVVDGLGVGPKAKQTYTDSRERFRSLPYSSKSIDRAHQLVFNQRVRVLANRGGETQVEIPDCMVQPSPKEAGRFLTVWVPERSLMSLEELQKRHLDLSKIPGDSTQTDLITLIEPHYSREQQRTFSAGTRFVLISEEGSSYRVWALKPNGSHFDQITLPKKCCVKNQPSNLAVKKQLFFHLLKTWANRPQGYIPYVLGGASWTNTYQSDSIVKSYAKDHKGNTQATYYWDGVTAKTKSGFDCSSLVFSAAQIAGLPYYCKNTTTIKNQLAPLKKGEKLEAGDLILYPGHVMIVSEVSSREPKTFKVIQARGYGAGDGKIFEADSQELFTNLDTADEFVSMYLSKKPFIMRNSKGARPVTINNWAIYKFPV